MKKSILSVSCSFFSALLALALVADGRSRAAATPTPQVPAGSEAKQVGPALHLTKSAPERRLVLRPGSRLWIEGSTSQRDFALWAGTLLGSAILKSPLDTTQGGDNLRAAVMKEGIQALNLVVPVENLRSGEKEMAGKEYAMAGPYSVLKGANHPYVEFRLEEESLKPGLSGRAYRWKAEGKLTVAGVTRDIRMEGDAVFSGNEARFTGSYPVRLKDYGLRVRSEVWGKMGRDASVEVHFDVIFGPPSPVAKGSLEGNGVVPSFH